MVSLEARSSTNDTSENHLPVPNLNTPLSQGNSWSPIIPSLPVAALGASRSSTRIHSDLRARSRSNTNSRSRSRNPSQTRSSSRTRSRSRSPVYSHSLSRSHSRTSVYRSHSSGSINPDVTSPKTQQTRQEAEQMETDRQVFGLRNNWPIWSEAMPRSWKDGGGRMEYMNTSHASTMTVNDKGREGKDKEMEWREVRRKDTAVSIASASPKQAEAWDATRQVSFSTPCLSFPVVLFCCGLVWCPLPIQTPVLPRMFYKDIFLFSLTSLPAWPSRNPSTRRAEVL
jgi:hypothetical protein